MAKGVIAALFAVHGLPKATPEYQFHETRRWRFDWAFPEQRVAMEIEGGAWQGGRHTRGKGFVNDIEKYAEAACLGWTVLRVTPQMLDDGRAFAWLKRIVDLKREVTLTRESGNVDPQSQRAPSNQSR